MSSVCLTLKEWEGESRRWLWIAAEAMSQEASGLALRNLDFTLSEIKCLWRDLSRGVPGSDLGFSSKSPLILCWNVLGGAWAEDKASCWNNPDERFIKFERELFSEDSEKLNEKNRRNPLLIPQVINHLLISLSTFNTFVFTWETHLAQLSVMTVLSKKAHTLVEMEMAQ